MKPANGITDVQWMRKWVEQRDVRWHSIAGLGIVNPAQRADDWFRLWHREYDAGFQDLESCCPFPFQNSRHRTLVCTLESSLRSQPKRPKWAGLEVFVLTLVGAATLSSSMIAARHELQPPQDADDWQTYHAIRRRVLFDRRGKTYDDQHPDERVPGHHALLLKHDGTAIGVIRVDIDGTTAIFRRVAIRESQQRSGHGRILLGLAESFARQHGCQLLYSFVAPDAVGFYEKCGFVVDPEHCGDAHHVPMRKELS